MTQRQPLSGKIIRDLRIERIAQEMKWGPQSHPDGTGAALRLFEQSEDVPKNLYTGGTNAEFAQSAIERCDALHTHGAGTWEHILTEEYAEALATDDPVLLRRELVQVMATAAAWIADIDSRTGGEAA